MSVLELPHSPQIALGTPSGSLNLRSRRRMHGRRPWTDRTHEPTDAECLPPKPISRAEGFASVCPPEQLHQTQRVELSHAVLLRDAGEGRSSLDRDARPCGPTAAIHSDESGYLSSCDSARRASVNRFASMPLHPRQPRSEEHTSELQ